MTADDHASSVDRLLTEEPPRSYDGPAATGRLRRLCRCAARDLSSSGVGVSVATADGSMVPPDVAEPRLGVDQAQGMLTVQLRVTADEALLRLRAYAYARDRPIDAVAADVIARRVRLDNDNW